MPHHVYTTEAFVIESVPSGEADRFFTLFTRDLGLIRATAKGVRLQRSKLRYSLQDFSKSRVSLVRGKDIWRITNARLEENLYLELQTEKAVIHLIAQLFALIRRLVGAEEKNEDLFNVLNDTAIFLKNNAFSKEELKYVEIIAVLRILRNLGYMRERPEFRKYFENEWGTELVISMKEHKESALKEINMSLRETQL